MSGIVIFGASGFIGQNLSNYFKAERIPFEFVSLRNHEWRRDLSPSVEVMINLIGKAHDHDRVASERDYYHANLEMAKSVFDTFLQSKARLLIHVSSLAALEEYESTTALTEKDSCNPTSWYGQSKREAETWLLSKELPTGKKLIILRPPMIHGLGDKGNLGLLYKFISKGIPYPLSAFNNRRSFISIDNFCYFIREIVNKSESLKSGIYHVTDDEALSTKDIVGLIMEVTGKKVINVSLPKFFVILVAKIGDIVPIPLNSARLRKITGTLLVSNERIKRHLNLVKLPLSAREGLKKTIQSFVDNERKKI